MWKKTVVYNLVNGSTVLLHIENSKNDMLKVILLCRPSTLTFSQTVTISYKGDEISRASYVVFEISILGYLWVWATFGVFS